MKGKIYFSPLTLEETRENMNSNSSGTNLLPSEMEFRVPVVRRRGGQGGRPVANAEVMEELRILQEEMAAMREAGRRDPEAGDVSEAEVEP